MDGKKKRTEKEISLTTTRELQKFKTKPPDDPIQARFEAYHEANPHVYGLLVKYTREAIKAAAERGRTFKRYGIQAVAERVRWHINFETESGEEFKISNDFLSRYSRLIMQSETDLREVFELRKLRANSNPNKESETSRNGNEESSNEEGRD